MTTDNSPPGPAAMPATDSPPSVTATSERQPPRVWNSEDLLGAESEVLILHRGQTYRLRCTKQGKLILYK